MFQPALVLWIIGIPLALAIVDLIRSLGSLRSSPPSQGGIWSETLKIGQHGQARAGH